MTNRKDKSNDANRRVREGDPRPGPGEGAGHDATTVEDAPTLAAIEALTGAAARAEQALLRAISGARARVVEELEEPIKAWKQAKIGINEGRLRFEGINSQMFYDVESQASCNKFGAIDWATLPPSVTAEGSLNHWNEWLEAGKLPKLPDHVCPVNDCTCGFYAWKDRPRSDPGLVTLEVEFYGKILQHSLGFRAEHQRVLAVHLRHGQAVRLCPLPHRSEESRDLLFPGIILERPARQRLAQYVELDYDGKALEFMCHECVKQAQYKSPMRAVMKLHDAVTYEREPKPTSSLDFELESRKYVYATEVLQQHFPTDFVWEEGLYPQTAATF